jgi:hypothetical protein
MKDTSNYYPVSLSKSDSPIKTIYLDLDALFRLLETRAIVILAIVYASPISLGGVIVIFDNASMLFCLVTVWSWVQVLEQPLAEIQGMTAYIRSKVVGSFPGLCVSGSYVHRAAPSMLF